MKPENVANWIYERIVCIVVIMLCIMVYVAIPTFYYESRKELKKQNTTMLKRAGSMIFGIDIN